MIPPGLSGFPVWPEHALALDVFAALESQWRIVSGFGIVHYAGIDYSAVTELFLSMMGVAPQQRGEVFSALRIMERAAGEVLNAKAKEASNATI